MAKKKAKKAKKSLLVEEANQKYDNYLANPSAPTFSELTNLIANAKNGKGNKDLTAIKLKLGGPKGVEIDTYIKARNFKNLNNKPVTTFGNLKKEDKRAILYYFLGEQMKSPGFTYNDPDLFKVQTTLTLGEDPFASLLKPEGGKPEGGKPEGGEPEGVGQSVLTGDVEPGGGKSEGGKSKGDKPDYTTMNTADFTRRQLDHLKAGKIKELQKELSDLLTARVGDDTLYLGDVKKLVDNLKKDLIKSFGDKYPEVKLLEMYSSDLNEIILKKKYDKEIITKHRNKYVSEDGKKLYEEIKQRQEQQPEPTAPETGSSVPEQEIDLPNPGEEEEERKEARKETTKKRSKKQPHRSPSFRAGEKAVEEEARRKAEAEEEEARRKAEEEARKKAEREKPPEPVPFIPSTIAPSKIEEVSMLTDLDKYRQAQKQLKDALKKTYKVNDVDTNFDYDKAKYKFIRGKDMHPEEQAIYDEIEAAKKDVEKYEEGAKKELKEKLDRDKKSAIATQRTGALGPHLANDSKQAVTQILGKTQEEQIQDIENWFIFDIPASYTGQGSSIDNPLIRQNEMRERMLLEGATLFTNMQNYTLQEGPFERKDFYHQHPELSKDGIGRGLFEIETEETKEQFLQRFNEGNNGLFSQDQTRKEVSNFENIYQKPARYIGGSDYNFEFTNNRGIKHTDKIWINNLNLFFDSAAVI